MFTKIHFKMQTRFQIIISAIASLYGSFALSSYTTGLILDWSKAIIVTLGTSLALFILSYFITDAIIKYMMLMIQKFNNLIAKADAKKVIIRLAGVVAGVLISALVSLPFLNLGMAYICISLGLYFCFGVAGYSFAAVKEKDFESFIISRRQNGNKILITNPNALTLEKTQNKNGIPKILDTSVIIDGRIYDLCKSGFIEGELIIPSVVLQELRHIADSSDTLKRNRGRRGLDVLKNIQLNVPVKIEEVRNMEGMEVDSVLLKMAKQMEAKVITNDYNLNKVAAVQDVDVLNINELANAIKPIVLPGEEMFVRVMKDGKENGQGVAYLEDGTMIVVEGGKYLIGKDQTVIVTSVLQTAAGRMIFAKPKDESAVS